MNSPLVMVIFGATGDLMNRKLMPALYHLIQDGALSRDLFIVGVGRRAITTDQFRELMARSVQDAYPKEYNQGLWEKIISHMHYSQGKFEDKKLYGELVSLLETFDKEFNACVPRFFYLATPPEHYETIINHLHESKLSEGCGQGTTLYTKVLIEKPFGKDLKTAKKLDELLGKTFEERQIYRIDHYLGKETVQNILSFRFANGIFEPTWNRNFIDHIQITLAEDVGVGTRGEFYDGVGAIRDVVQNHMLEMMALIAMDQPKAFDAQSIRDERVKMIQAIESKGVGKAVVRGQYAGYQKEKNVNASSATETFVALKLILDTPRWKGVPFYIRTGKHLTKKVTEISIHYKKPAVCRMDPKDPSKQVCLFPEPDVMRNVLAIRVEPDEGIALRLMAKKPGFTMKLSPVEMDFTYKQSFATLSQPTAYERLLLDAIRGDQTLFARTDGIDASWTFVTKILHAWSKGKSHVYEYALGTWGPKEAQDLIENDGRHWFLNEN
jgi:glucose-6-phosphate 1-dehydrogenase